MSALLATVRPLVAASASPTLAKIASRSPGTVKPVALLVDGAGAGIEERVTDCVPSAGGIFIAPSVLGMSRSGGTSSGRLSGLCA
jgi:hypothetical protein